MLLYDFFFVDGHALFLSFFPLSLTNDDDGWRFLTPCFVHHLSAPLFFCSFFLAMAFFCFLLVCFVCWFFETNGKFLPFPLAGGGGVAWRGEAGYFYIVRNRTAHALACSAMIASREGRGEERRGQGVDGGWQWMGYERERIKTVGVR
jgi:hypothetical protein